MRILQVVGGVFEDEPGHQLARRDHRCFVALQQLDAASPAGEESVRFGFKLVLDTESYKLLV